MKWGTCLDTMKAAFQMEKAVNENLLELAKKADVQGDFHLLNFLNEFIKDQVVKSLMSDIVEVVLRQVVKIKSIGETITKLERVGNSFGIFLLDNDDFKLKLISQKIKQDKNNNTNVFQKVYQNIEIHTLFNFDHTFPYFCYVPMISLDHKKVRLSHLPYSLQ